MKSNLKNLIDTLRGMPTETEWVEFKENNHEPQIIGEYISALSNSAFLHDQKHGYLIYGIQDKTHKVVGTDFKPKETKGKGNEDLEPWLARGLRPRIDFKIIEFDYEEHHIVIFHIDAIKTRPVSFNDRAYIRIGSYKKLLSDFPEKERKIWDKASKIPFEEGVALSQQTSDDVLAKIDYPNTFELLGIPLPDSRQGILDKLTEELIITPNESTYDITNLGGILFAKDFNQFPSLVRKAARVIVYSGEDRLNAEKEQTGARGYAVGFKELIDWIYDRTPANEIIEDALRVEEKMYPKVAIREIVANALIHQDFSISGAGPMVEIFKSRIEISNPGQPLIDPRRFIDHAPRSRNEKLASIMRRMNICEERGSGIDRAIGAIELFQLPAPSVQVENDFIRITIFAYRPLKDMDRNDRIRACYQHCCLRWVCKDFMTNSSLRKRFGIDDKNYPMASKIIRDALNADLIKEADPANKSNRDKKYLPFWA